MSHAIGGSGDSSVYRGLTTGPRGFLPFRMSPFSRLILFSSDTGGRIGIARDINSCCSPSFMPPLEPHDPRVSRNPVFSERIWRIGCSADDLTIIPFSVFSGFGSDSTEGLGSSGLPVGGRIPPGVLPFVLSSGFGKPSRGTAEVFSRLRGGAQSSTRDFGEVR